MFFPHLWIAINWTYQGVIEDFTKQGVADLQAGLLRTPLPALTTFKDDPLRVLRAVRDIIL
jgi:tRNA nucleotidyltransferase (CCA-adding enzyme)